VEWIAIVVAATVVLAGVLAIVAVVAAGASDRVREGVDVARSALLAAGFSAREQHLLATMASVARDEIGAATVEVVLVPVGWSGDGVVVTGCRMAPERIGARIVAGSGTAGRAIASGRTILSEPRVAVAVPIPGPTQLIGVVVAIAIGPEGLFGAAEVARLEALADQTARQLAVPATRTA
jgi:hypothetical protein